MSTCCLYSKFLMIISGRIIFGKTSSVWCVIYVSLHEEPIFCLGLTMFLPTSDICYVPYAKLFSLLVDVHLWLVWTPAEKHDSTLMEMFNIQNEYCGRNAARVTNIPKKPKSTNRVENTADHVSLYGTKTLHLFTIYIYVNIYIYMHR